MKVVVQERLLRAREFVARAKQLGTKLMTLDAKLLKAFPAHSEKLV